MAAFAVVASLGAATACSGGDSANGPTGSATRSTGTASPELGKLFGSGEFSESVVSVLAESLDEAGIQVVDRTKSEPSVFQTAIVVSTDEVAGMTAELVAGNGFTGRELDEMAPLERPLPPFSYLMAGWASATEGRGAKLTRMLLGDQDWSHPQRIIWPNAVIKLFLSDLLAPTAASIDMEEAGLSGPPSIVPAVLRAEGTKPLCTAVTDFIDRQIGALFAAIENAAKAVQSKAGIFGQILAAGIRLFGEVVKAIKDVIAGITAVALAPIQTILGLLGTLSLIADHLRPWDIRLDPNPVGPFDRNNPTSGTFEGKLDPLGKSDFPDEIIACANATGTRQLPKSPTIGATVNWESVATPPDAITNITHDDKTNDERRADLRFDVVPEEPDNADGIPLEGALEVTMRPERKDVQGLIDLAMAWISGPFNGLPAVLRELVVGKLKETLNRLAAAIQTKIGPARGAVATVTVTYRAPKQKKKPRRDPKADLTAYCSNWADYELGFGTGSKLTIDEHLAALARLPQFSPPQVRADVDLIVNSTLNRPGGTKDLAAVQLASLRHFRFMNANCTLDSLHGWPLAAILPMMEAGAPE